MYCKMPFWCFEYTEDICLQKFILESLRNHLKEVEEITMTRFMMTAYLLEVIEYLNTAFRRIFCLKQRER